MCVLYCLSSVMCYDSIMSLHWPRFTLVLFSVQTNGRVESVRSCSELCSTQMSSDPRLNAMSHWAVGQRDRTSLSTDRRIPGECNKPLQVDNTERVYTIDVSLTLTLCNFFFRGLLRCPDCFLQIKNWCLLFPFSRNQARTHCW